jgi:hypothetical protein
MLPKHQTPNTKHQRTFKLQPSNSGDRKFRAHWLELGIGRFVDVWSLVFGVSAGEFRQEILLCPRKALSF